MYDLSSRLRSTEIATITYRSGPEWDQRFGRKMRPIPEGEQAATSDLPRVPALCPDFLIETYLDYQVRLDSDTSVSDILIL